MNSPYGGLSVMGQPVPMPQAPVQIPGGPGQAPGTMVTWPPPSGASALLEPPSTRLRAANGSYYTRPNVPIDRPRPWFPEDPNIGRQVRRMVRNFSGIAAGTETSQNIQIDIPATVYALTGAAVNAVTGADQGLNSFRIRMEYVTGDRLDSNNCLGGAILGTGAFPAFIGDTGWSFDRGSVIRIFITPLVANLAVDIAVWWIEVRGPVNFSMS